MMNDQQELSGKEREILDSALKQALDNKEGFEGIKSGIVRTTILALFQDAHTKKSKIAGLLIQTLAKDKELSKKTGISQGLIYWVLRAPEFKALKDESHAKRRRDKGQKTIRNSSSTKSIPNPAPTCTEILSEEIKKIKEEKSELSNKEIRDLLVTLPPIKQFTISTVLRNLSTLLPLREYHERDHNTPTIASSGLSQEALNQQELEKTLLERMKIIDQVLHWLSGMDEPDRTAFRKSLPKGKAYGLALEEKCVDHIRVLVKMMLDSDLNTFLNYSDDLAHVNRIFDEELYNEKQLRQTQRSMASR